MPTIHISDSGDDKNDGLSLKTPIYSLKQAMKLNWLSLAEWQDTGTSMPAGLMPLNPTWRTQSLADITTRLFTR